MQKATHEPYNVELFAPIIKDTKGKYLAVLSDDSVDRDGEMVGRSCIEDMGKDENYLAALVDHENKALNQVAKWVNRRVVDVGGRKALVAEPHFFMSNPKAKIIKGMMDEGAQFGISISAIVKQYEDQKRAGKSMRVYTELEQVEASFCGIPSNRHGHAMAVAKSFNKSKEADNMSEEKFTQEHVDAEVEKKATELTKTFDADKADLDKKLEDMKEAKEQLDKSLKAEKEAKETAEKKLSDVEKELKETKEALETEKKKPVDKGAHDQPVITDEEVEKAEKAGHMPIAFM